MFVKWFTTQQTSYFVEYTLPTHASQKSLLPASCSGIYEIHPRKNSTAIENNEIEKNKNLLLDILRQKSESNGYLKTNIQATQSHLPGNNVLNAMVQSLVIETLSSELSFLNTAQPKSNCDNFSVPTVSFPILPPPHIHYSHYDLNPHKVSNIISSLVSVVCAKLGKSRIQDVKGGGIALYINQRLSHKIIIKSGDDSVAEYLGIMIDSNITKSLLKYLYNPHKTHWMDEVLKVMDGFSILYKHILLCGDLNVDLQSSLIGEDEEASVNINGYLMSFPNNINDKLSYIN
ncbi:hypothetical protein GQX74_014516 [Glossina fuscipes]|nr:hypothetical protein GQX74_014516 [Glossina fuscipes]